MGIKIRKEIKSDGTFGGNYPYDIDYLTIPSKYIDITEEQRDIIDQYPLRYKYDESQNGIFKEPKGVVDISNTDEYKLIQFNNAKKRKKKINTNIFEKKNSFSSSLGNVNINTPVGRVDIMVTGFLNFVTITKKNLPSGTFRLYDNQGNIQDSPELTPAEVSKFYLEIFNKFNECDKRYKQFEAAIDNSKSIEELEAIEFVYTDI